MFVFKDMFMIYIRKDCFGWIFWYETPQVKSLDASNNLPLKHGTYRLGVDDYSLCWQWKVRTILVFNGSESVFKKSSFINKNIFLTLQVDHTVQSALIT